MRQKDGWMEEKWCPGHLPFVDTPVGREMNFYRAFFPANRQSACKAVASFASFVKPVEFLRNVAIIAHVDHGKTTLVDSLLRQSGITDGSQERLMDCNELERERGITILAKATTIEHEAYRINLVDTPGHADFGGEVERVLNMVNGVLLVVDATEGPMAQTKFVLSKALKAGLNPIVVLNKVDRPSCRIYDVECELLDLFMMLGATDAQLNYSTVYASAKEGWATMEQAECLSNAKVSVNSIGNCTRNMNCLFQQLIQKVPHPQVSREKPFSMLVNGLEGNPYLGNCSFGLISTGKIAVGDAICSLSAQSALLDSGKVSKLFIRKGLVQVPVEEAAAGDIITLAGISEATVNSTICAPAVKEALPTHEIDSPTLSIVFGVNNSPLAGTEGKAVSNLQLGERLKREAQNNVSVRLMPSENTNEFQIFGRGEMQLGILIETMRREGMEFSIYPPQVLTKTCPETGKTLEPIEELIIDVDLEYSGVVIEKLARRKGELIRMTEHAGDKTRMIFHCPTRGLLGYSNEFKNDTRGTGIMNHSLCKYSPVQGAIQLPRKGSIISMADGVATTYALLDLEARGTLFVAAGARTYPGMIIGESSKPHDLEVNPVKCKVQTNFRVSSKEEFVRCVPPKVIPLEEMISYMQADELIEVTPKNLRLRKQELDSNKRRMLKKLAEKKASA